MPVSTIDSTGLTASGVTPASLDSNAQYTGFKNRIINGGMVIDQRNAGAAVTATGAYPVDRFLMVNSTDGTFSAQQDSSAPVGFVNSLKVTTTAADTSLITTQQLVLQQRIEGYNVADLGWGTANAKTVTLSFWVRSSLTGTFGGALRNSASDRSYVFTYSISVADTWEQKSVTVTGDTSGTWLTTNGVGISVSFGLGVGPDRSGTAGAWAGATYSSATGAVSVVGTNGATFYITGVQLEKGSTATSFDYRPYGTELQLAQRYYFKVVGSTFPNASFGSGKFTSSTAVSIYAAHPVAMRDLPTWSYGGTVVAEGTSGFAISAIAAQYPSYYATRLALTVSGATAGQGAIAQISTTSSDFVQATSEL